MLHRCIQGQMQIYFELMKYSSIKQRIKTEPDQLEKKCTASNHRRMSTQTPSLMQQIDYSTYSLKRKAQRLRFTEQQTVSTYYQNFAESPICQPKLKIRSSPGNWYVASSMSSRPYGRILGYGWAMLRQRNNNQNSLSMSIQLGSIRIFVMVQCKRIKNLNAQQQISKQLCQDIIMKILDKNGQSEGLIDSKKVSAAIQYVKMNKNLNQMDFSLACAVIQDNLLIFGSHGTASVVCFTTAKILMGLFEPEKFNHQNYYTAVTYRNRSLQSSYKQNQILKSVILSKKDKSIQTKQFLSDDICWFTLSTSKSKSPTEHNKFKNYLQNSINKQILDGFDKNSYGQIAMQSCKKVINQINQEKQPTGLIVVLLQKTLTKEQNKKGANLWTNQKKMNQPDINPEIGKPKIFRYAGNRRSFIKKVQ